MEPLIEPTNRFNSVSFVVIALIVAFVGGGFWYLNYSKKMGNTNRYSEEKTPFSTLVLENPFFAEANAAMKAGNYVEAKRLYEQSLAVATDSMQASQIQFTLALIEDRYGSATRAVDLYKQIVVNPANDNSPLMRANAVANMVELYYRNGNPEVTAQIFKDLPYLSFVVAGDTNLTYRKLAEYAVAHYPLALPELRIAGWYSYRLVTESDARNGEATSTYPAIIQNAISLANRDIDRLKTNTDAAKMIPDILTRKSALYLNMYKAGLASAQETEQITKDALDLYASIGAPDGIDGFARYYYAVFLSEQDASRLSDLQTILAPLYENTTYRGTAALSFFASEKSNSLDQKARLVKLSRADPKFKALLISLGWNERDF